MTTARLPPVTRLLVSAQAVSSLGTGLVLPLTLIYLHQVRGIALPVVGALLAMSGLAGLIAVPLSGVLLDRFGARRVLFTGLSALPAPPGLRIACVMSFTALFGLGETFIAPTVTPLVNSLADERVQGRANALSSSAYSLAFVVSPAISTGMIAAGIPAVWIGLLCAGCLGTVLFGARLGRQLTHVQDRVDAAEAPVQESAHEPAHESAPESAPA